MYTLIKLTHIRRAGRRSTRVCHPKGIYKPETEKYVVKNTWLCRIVLDRSNVVECLYKQCFMNCWDLFVHTDMKVSIFLWTFVEISYIHIWILTFFHMNIVIFLHERCWIPISSFSLIYPEWRPIDIQHFTYYSWYQQHYFVLRNIMKE